MIAFANPHLLFLVPPILLFEGLFSGSEIALLSADKLTLKKLARNRVSGASLALDLATHPERVLSTTLLMTSLSIITISGLITLCLLERFPSRGSLLSVLITSPLVVIFGELLPKTIYQRFADRVAPWVAYPVFWAYWAFFPLTRVLSFYTTRLSHLVGPVEELLAGKRLSTREEIRSLLSYGRKETEIKTSEKHMIKRIFEFKDSEAKHALIPLVKVEAIDESTTVQEALERFENHRHSRMPVYSERIDNIVGVLEISDLFTAGDLQQSIRYYVSPAHYVAETQSLEDLLSEMRLEDNEMVVVVDEYGGAIGVLTFEDIVEEIVGEISDEDDSEAALFKELSDRSWLIQGRMEIAEINEKLRLELPQGDYETLGGFLLQQFGRIPETRDELFFTTPGGPLKLTIHKANERQIEAVRVEQLSETKPTH